MPEALSNFRHTPTNTTSETYGIDSFKSGLDNRNHSSHCEGEFTS